MSCKYGVFAWEVVESMKVCWGSLFFSCGVSGKSTPLDHFLLGNSPIKLELSVPRISSNQRKPKPGGADGHSPWKVTNGPVSNAPQPSVTTYRHPPAPSNAVGKGPVLLFGGLPLGIGGIADFMGVS